MIATKVVPDLEDLMKKRLKEKKLITLEVKRATRVLIPIY